MFRPLFELLCLLMGPPLAGGPREHPWLMSPSSVLLKDHIMGLCLLKGYVDTWLMSPTEQDLRAHLNSGDEVKILLQAAVSRAKRAGISQQVLSSCMDDCYREVNCSSSITLPPNLDDVLDLSAFYRR